MTDYGTERRYFRLSGRLLTIAIGWKETVWRSHREELKAFCDRIGTTEFIQQGRTLVAFTDAGIPIEGSRKSSRGSGFLEPNRRSKAGKALQEELRSLTPPRCEVLFDIVAPDRPWLVGDYRSVIHE